MVNLVPRVFWVFFKMVVSQPIENRHFEKYPEDPGNEVVYPHLLVLLSNGKRLPEKVSLDYVANL